MAKKLKSDEALKVLNEIEKSIKKLNPPVEDFEKSIRRSDLSIIISIILSSRTKDQTTQKASERLFKRVKTIEDIMNLEQTEIEELIYPVGFYKQKAKNIKKLALKLKELGEIPNTLEDLIKLPGIGRKTANLVLSLIYNKPSIAVDIHVFRISNRLGWVKTNSYEVVEKELKKLFQKKDWNRVNRILVGFGQTICKPKNPNCNTCRINQYCDYFKNKNG